VIEIGKLAVYLRQQEQLDSEGVIQAQMAEDLADTNPAVMVATFALARKRCTFLPVTKELIEIYNEALRTHNDAADKAARAAEDEAFAKLKREHPERFITVGEVLREGGFAEETLAMDARRKSIAAAAAKHDAETPRTTECPQCGAVLPVRIQDVNLVPTEHLRAIVRIRKLRQRELRKVAAAMKESK
jgi:galactokinase